MRHRNHPERAHRQAICRAAVAALAAGAAALAAPPAVAALSCTMNAPSTMVFGTYDTINAATTAITISVNCTGNGSATPTVAASAGGGSYSNRQMTRTGGSNLLSYNLYIDSAHTMIWGDGISGGTSTISFGKLNNVSSVSATVYGLIRGGQNVVPGAYADHTITITFSY
ncbi:spore coat U domain-containing protein [Burkholderia oklahomensis]|nr:spore coat U domain-containing protein [Burkholderia oklahomensis]MDN7672218.1 spore coat U domain-containing protein [Burkholderia oklahomensis]